MEDIFKNYSNSYFNKIQSKLKQLDDAIEEQEKILKELEELNEEKQKMLEAEKLHEALLNSRYNNFINNIKEKGIILKAENKRFKLMEWDNLFFAKRGSLVLIQSKYKEEIIVFSKEESKLLIDLLQQFNYNLIVIEINGRNIVIQLRLSNNDNV